MVQNFKITFNSVEAISFILWEMGGLEKGCVRLNVFVQLSSWIYAECRKTEMQWYVYIEVDYIEIDNRLLLWRKVLQKSPKIV